jgi:hypothetical protein
MVSQWLVPADSPRNSFALSAGMIAVVSPGALHRFRSADGKTTMSATIPGDHVDSMSTTPGQAHQLDIGNTMRPPSIIDLNTELTKLTMFRGRTPRSTMVDRKGTRLACYRDGTLSVTVTNCFTSSTARRHWKKAGPNDRVRRAPQNGAVAT